MSKYPPFDRVTAGRLAVGDLILVRDGAQDQQVADQGEYDRESRTYVGRTYLAHGAHRVTGISAELHRGGYGKASRYYTVELDNGQKVVSSAVQRWNRVVA